MSSLCGTDGIIQTSPACRRAVHETIAALRAAGHECVEFVPPKAVETIAEYVAITSADGTKTLLDPVGDDPEVAEISGITAAKFPGFVRWLATWALGKIFGDTLFPDVLRQASPKSANDYWKHVERSRELIRNYNEEVSCASHHSVSSDLLTSQRCGRSTASMVSYVPYKHRRPSRTGRSTRRSLIIAPHAHCTADR